MIDSRLQQRWKRTGAEQNLSSDSQIAAFLLRRYGESRAKVSVDAHLCSSPDAHLCSTCQSPLTLICLTCHPARSKCNNNNDNNYDDTLTSTIGSDSDDGSHHVIHDSDSDDDSHHVIHDSDSVSDALSPTSLADGKCSTMESTVESTSTNGGMFPEKRLNSFSAASGSNNSKDCGGYREVGEVASLTRNADAKVSGSCFLKLVDISSSWSVEELQRKGLLPPGESGQLRESENKKKRATQQNEREVKTNAINIGASRHTEVLSRNSKTGESEAVKEKASKTQDKRGAGEKKTKGKKVQTNSIRGSKHAEALSQDSEGKTELTTKKRGRPRKKELCETSERGEKKSFQCRVCSLTIQDGSSRRVHERSHAIDGKGHQCEQCPAVFRTVANLVRHRRLHSGEKPFRCEVCAKSFARSNTLRQHKLIHTNDRPYKCPQCGEAFRQRGMVAVHRLKVHTLERPFGCNVCGATFVVKGHLQVHVQSHTGHRPYLCEECGASFTKKGILETHRMIHAGVKPFSCDICPKSFYRMVDVRAHRKTHLNIRDAVCSECGAAFVSKSTLKRHMQIHTGFRPFSCPECGKNFASKSELKVHTRIHFGLKPYICDVCQRGFQTMGNMKKHRNNRHKHAPPYVSASAATGAERLEEGSAIKRSATAGSDDSSPV
ncbi:hypothetical protein ACOMHN_045123 [Nucella lapillus]